MPAGVQSLSGSVSPRVDADPHAFAGSTAILVAGLLLLLYFYRRKRYILYWSAGWMLTAGSMLIASVATGKLVSSAEQASKKIPNLMFGLSQFIGIVAALVFVVSADAYRSRPKFRREYALGLLAMFLWFTIAPLVLERVGPAFVPGHLLIGLALGAAGVAHIGLLRQLRLLGALLCGCMMMVTGATHLWVAYNLRSPTSEAVPEVMLLMTVVFILTALGMQLMTFEDMTYELRVTNRRLENAQGELKQLVTTDALTGCRNRRYFDEVIDREMERHRRYHIPLSLMFLDVDRFKVVNDTLGHEAGDRVLQMVATFLLKHVREADYVFRWGGDEFIIMISCREEQAQHKAQELRGAFALSEALMTLAPEIGLSIGCAEVPPEADTIIPFVKKADERMYAAKRRAAGITGPMQN
jgi:diguanylate cyclase (GGDEF)-like protein